MSFLSLSLSFADRTGWVIPETYTHPHSCVKRYESRKASSDSPRSRKCDKIRASCRDSVYENRTEEIFSQQLCLPGRGSGLMAVAQGVCSAGFLLPWDSAPCLCSCSRLPVLMKSCSCHLNKLISVCTDYLSNNILLSSYCSLKKKEKKIPSKRQLYARKIFSLGSENGATALAY